MNAHTWSMRARYVGAASVALACATSIATAQAPVDSSVSARAGSHTVGEYCGLVTRILTQDSVRRALSPIALEVVESRTKMICNPTVAALSLRALAADKPASFSAIARLRQAAYRDAAAAPLGGAMRDIRGRLRRPDVLAVIRATSGDSTAKAFAAVTDAAQIVLTEESRDNALHRLANYERKLGLQAPQLNGVEVLLNYSAQRWLPGFAASPTRGPSPLELIANYVPSYASGADKKAVAVSASEFGVRGYLFGDNWGKTGREGILKPAYWSLGALVAGDRNGALSWPWDGRTRTGVFVGWGELKVGYIAGRKGSVLVTRQVQFIPYLF